MTLVLLLAYFAHSLLCFAYFMNDIILLEIYADVCLVRIILSQAKKNLNTLGLVTRETNTRSGLNHHCGILTRRADIIKNKLGSKNNLSFGV